MLEILLFIYALIALILSTITDLKKREVLDTANLTLFSVSLITVIIYSLINSTFTPLIGSIKTFVPLTILAFALYYLRQWGGGDTKLLIALSIALAFPLKEQLFLNASLNFIINLILTGALIGIIYALIIIFKNFREFIEQLKSTVKEYKLSLCLFIFFGILIFVLSYTQQNNLLKAILYSSSTFLFITPILHVIFKSIENIAMIKTIEVNKLTPGDWIIDKTLRNKFNISTLGIEEEQILKLKNSNIKQVKVKEGIPFVPIFLIAYLLTMFNINLLITILYFYF